jgi:uncharacterized protein YbjT (DUF2867 family)
MLSNDKKLIAVIGSTGQQGGGVVRALQAGVLPLASVGSPIVTQVRGIV